MIQEEYCSFEQAKALKELGFPLTFIDNDINPGWPNTWYVPQEYGYYLLPTLSLVQKWLREEKNLHIAIHITSSSWYYIMLFDVSSGFFRCEDTSMYKTYEQALSAAIDECIELLKEK